ncbi:MAG: cobalt ECF transporter T component CbiQ [Desulfuromonadales bacterium]
MGKIDLSVFDIGYLDTLSYHDTAIHRLDPRAKLITTLVFIVCIASFGKYQVSALLPFLLFPATLIALGDLPTGYLLKKLLLVAPFAVMIGIFNPLIDQETLLRIGPLGISGGWISFLSILLRFILTVGAALILIATTSFPAVCRALDRLGVPRVFAVQLLFIYRYIFVLTDEAMRMVRARSLRSFHGRGRGMRVYGHMIGQLLLRTLDRAQRIHKAMLSRGFDGEIRIFRPGHIGMPEVLFTAGWSAFFILARTANLPDMLGRFALEIAR